MGHSKTGVWWSKDRNTMTVATSQVKGSKTKTKTLVVYSDKKS